MKKANYNLKLIRNIQKYIDMDQHKDATVHSGPESTGLC